MIDFNKLARPTASAASLDPLEIFGKTPNLKDAPNDLWKGQAEALSQWHERRSDEDNVILLNTGAGKSIVGVLMAQSLVNETIGPIVYTCSTIDLMYQTSRECDRLGMSYSLRAQGKFSNNLYETGKAFCITTYQALFAPITAFVKDKAPAGVIFDDAHVSERLIRDSFTLTINRAQYPDVFERIIEAVRPEFSRVGREDHFNFVLDAIGQQDVTMCPPLASINCAAQIREAIKSYKDWRQSDLFFSSIRLWENLQRCAIFVSPSTIEITPPFIPTGLFDFLRKGVRRIYLSATLDFETDFVRGFGGRKVNRIAPDNDAGNGERLILLSDKFATGVSKVGLASELLKKHKLLISVPSYYKAEQWSELAKPPARDSFSSELEAFRKAAGGAFILVSRIDGIDLPQDTCRVMLIDGAPAGTSLMDRYQLQTLAMSNLFSTKMASRITQLLGRINRGRSDYSVFVLFEKDILNWLQTERNVALLPPLVRRQVILGRTVQEGMGQPSSTDVNGLIIQVLARDSGWLKFYRDTVDGLEVSEESLQRVRERESKLALSAAAECKYMTHLWEGDVESARKALLDVLDDTALADAKLAGWYSVWLGSSYEAEGDYETAVAHYKKARARLSKWLNVPFRSKHDARAIEEGAETTVQTQLISINHDGPQALGNIIGKLRLQATAVNRKTGSSNSKEEAVRLFGELIGFTASRPDNEVGSGPDVVWMDPDTNELVAFELKTQKIEPATYSKHEVGQAHNHLQWLKDNQPDAKYGGLIVVGPLGNCAAEASPSEGIFLVETSALAARMAEFAAKIDDLRGRTEMERWAALKELGGLPEWQVSGWFRTLAVLPLGQTKTH